MSVIVGPTPDLGIELPDHGYRVHAEMLTDCFPDIPQECFYIRLGRLNDKLAIVFANILPEKIESFIYPYNSGFGL